MAWVLYAVALGIGTAVYAGSIVRFAAGFRRVLRQPVAPHPAYRPAVSVVIPARNEEATIGACVTSVLANDYPAGLVEVIVVDDQSTDATAAVVRRLAAQPVSAGGGGEVEEAPVRLVQVGRDERRRRAHKKHAIERGIAAAAGELILTTDADCTVSPTWIRTMVAQFGHDVGFVTGPVLYELRDEAFAQMQVLEFLGFVAIGAGTVGIGRPHLCNGANLAYRRAAFIELGGYEGLDHVTSGDDELLMHKFAYDSPWDVRSCMARQAVVHTPPNPTVRALFAQRRRWASLDLHYTERWLAAISVGFYAFYVLLLAGLLAAPFAPSVLPLVGGALVAKLGAEAALLHPASRHFERARLFFKWFVPTQLLQIPYIVLVGAAGILGGYTWKERTIDR